MSVHSLISINYQCKKINKIPLSYLSRLSPEILSNVISRYPKKWHQFFSALCAIRRNSISGKIPAVVRKIDTSGKIPTVVRKIVTSVCQICHMSKLEKSGNQEVPFFRTTGRASA